MEPTSSVRRPESGTWQSVAMETAAMGGRTGTMTDYGPGAEAEGGVRGPWQITGPRASSKREKAPNLPAPHDKIWEPPRCGGLKVGTWQKCGDGGPPQKGGGTGA
ncbi:unnamed protein product, partial [Staurois parvus]